MYELGMAYAHLGETEKALKWFSLVEGSARANYAWDQFALRRSLSYIKAKAIDPLELMLHDAERLRRIKRYKEAVDFMLQNKVMLDPNTVSKNALKILPDYNGWYGQSFSLIDSVIAYLSSVLGTTGFSVAA